MNKVNQYKLNKVKLNLLNNKNYKDSQLDVGLSESYARRGKDNAIVKEALRQIATDMARKGLTAEVVLEKMDNVITDTETLIAKIKSSPDWHKNDKKFKQFISSAKLLKDTLEICARHLLSTTEKKEITFTEEERAEARRRLG